MKSNRFGFITIIISILVMLVAILKKGGLPQFFNVLEKADLRWIAAAFFVIITYWVLDGVIISLLTKSEYKGYPLCRSLVTAMIGLLYNALTPFAVGGQPMQVFEMSKTGVRGGDACAYITVKSIIYQAMLTIMPLIALLLMGAYFIPKIESAWVYIILGLVCNCAFVSAVLLMCFKVKFTKRAVINALMMFHKTGFLKKPKKTIRSCLRHIDIFHNSITRFKKRSMLLFSCAALTFFQMMVYYLIPYFIFKSFRLTLGVELELPVGIYMVGANAIISMITAFVPLPGAAGAAEGSFFLFFGLFFPKAFLIPAIALWRFITYYLCIISGAVISVFGVSKTKSSAAP